MTAIWRLGSGGGLAAQGRIKSVDLDVSGSGDDTAGAVALV